MLEYEVATAASGASAALAALAGLTLAGTNRSRVHMSVVQPAFETIPHSPFGAVVARQLSVWPFGARTARLFVLVDPSLADETLRGGLLRAMQQGYFASDGYSQTRAVREAALAAHYVLRHHNRDVLPTDHVNAASAVAAVRGKMACVALAGQAAAFAWRNGELSGQRGILRLPRPLGLEQDPPLMLWRTPLQPGDRLVLVCGATWRPDAEQLVRTILSANHSPAATEAALGEALGDTRPAGVVVIAPGHTSFRAPHLRLLSANPRHASTTTGTLRRPTRWILPLLGLLMLGLIALAALAIAPQATTATGRVDAVSPRMAVRLGPAAASNIVDLAVGHSALYTLDVSEGAVHAFSLDGVEQQPGPETLVARAGTQVLGSNRSLMFPVGIEYVPDAASNNGSLTIVDQSRAVAQVAPDGTLSAHEVPTSANWQALGALGAGSSGELFFLDSGTRQLLAYGLTPETVVDPPRLVLDASNAQGLPFEHVTQVIGVGESVVARLDDGSVHRVNAGGSSQPLVVPSTGGVPTRFSAVAPDRAGGVYLADPLDARVVRMRLDGTIVHELRAAALAGVRAIDVTLDGRRLYALVDSGVLVFDIPAV